MVDVTSPTEEESFARLHLHLTLRMGPAVIFLLEALLEEETSLPSLFLLSFPKRRMGFL